VQHLQCHISHYLEKETQFTHLLIKIFLKPYINTVTADPGAASCV